MNILKRNLTRVRRRIQLERLLKGVAVLLVYLLVGFLAVVPILARNNFSDSAIFWARLLFVGGFLFLLWRQLIRPLFRLPTLLRIASFLEERHPELEQRLSTAVELGSGHSKVHPVIRRLIRKDAQRELGRVPRPRFYWPRVSQASIVTAAVCLLAGLVLWTSGPAEYRYGFDKLLGVWSDEVQPPLYRVVVEPGSTTVAERADLEIVASLVGFESDEVELFARYNNSPQWESTRMVLQPAESRYTFLFFDVREPIDYYVAADGIRSDTYRIEVSEMPRVERVILTLTYPSYTGMSEAVLEDETYIRALKGTEVDVRVETDQPASRGLIRFENGPELELEREGATFYGASFTITDDDYFRILLANAESVLSPASDEYVVEALEDQRPVISFTHPGRDQSVTNIEEVFTEVKVEDDHGLLDLTLFYSINGNEAQSEALPVPRGSRSSTASHTFYLEEHELEPGDFISYYAKTRDAISEAATEIFFLEVRPFDRTYSQSQMSAGGGAAGQQGLQLAQQQKQIVVATFALIEEEDTFEPADYIESSQTLALVQQRLQTQAQTIVERIERRGAAAADARFRTMMERMREAIEHMKLAEQALNEVDPVEALPEAQKSLQQLMRAEALFNEVEVSMAQGGGGGQSAAEDLADLVDLELDQTKNQYETLQQNRQQQQDQSLDEALEKLKELAQRQQRELERRQQQSRSSQSGGGGSSSASQRAEELEELARQLARLSREQQNQELSRISRELNRAAREMRQSDSSGQSSQESAELARQAMERLERARQRLGQQRESQMRSQFEELKERASSLIEEQEEVVENLGNLQGPGQGEEPTEEFIEGLRQVYFQKQDLEQELQALESELHQAARRLESEEPDASRKLKGAGLSIRDKRIPDMMQEGSQLLRQGLTSLAERRERSIEGELRSLAEQIEEAEQSLGRGSSRGSEEDLQRALDEAGRLVENLESLRRRAQPGEEQASSETGESRAEGEPSARNESGRQGSESSPSGQPGEQESAQSTGGGGEAQVGTPRGSSPRTGGAAMGLAPRGADPEQMRREWNQRMDEAGELRQLLQGADRGLAGQADQLLRKMRELDLGRILSDEAEVRRLKADIIDGLHQLELEISRTLAEDEEEFLRPVNVDEVPPEFRQRVEDYYRRLSSRNED